MRKKPDGGPAFPCPDVVWDDPRTGAQTGRQGDPGMSLRDHFAGQALFVAYSELARQMGEGELVGFGWSSVASDAYRIADAMIAEREK